MTKIGIRHEDKNIWEKRTPIVPNHMNDLIKKKGLEFIVQQSPTRAFNNDEYKSVGAEIVKNLDKADIVLAIKEIPVKYLRPNKVYIFFSHTIKAQKHNMPMLKHILDSGSTLIDYERILNDKGFRLVFFGNWAGLAGINQTLWSYGQRMIKEGIKTPFSGLKHTYEYSGIEELKAHMKEIGDEIKKKGLNKNLVPFICGFAGYGNVSRGAQEVYDMLPVIEIQPKDLKTFYEKGEFSSNNVYKVVFKEEDMVVPINESDKFELQDYYKNGKEKYRGIFQEYIPYITVLINAIYWSEKYPKLLTKGELKKIYSDSTSRLKTIGDISCDLEGAIEGTLIVTKPDKPVFSYNPETDEAKLGIHDGIDIMAVDNLPCELPKESSTSFSSSLLPFIESIANADYSVSFTELNLLPEIKKAVIVYQGKLTSDYKYLKEHI